MRERGAERSLEAARRGRRPVDRRVLVLALLALALALVVVAAAALAIGRPPGDAADPGSPIPDPVLVSCGTGRGDSIAPFGCGESVSTDATGQLGRVAVRPISLQFDAALGGRVGIGVDCGGLGGVPVHLTTTRFRTDTARGVRAVDGFGPCRTAAARTLRKQVYGVFDGGVAYSISGDVLTVSRGDTLIRLRRAPLPSPTPVP